MKSSTKNNKPLNLTQAREYLIDLLPKAGETLRKYYNSGTYISHQKEGVDFTTEADLKVDTFLQKNIKKAFPNTSFLTEETAPKEYSSYKNIENLWVIDPLDGTINFSRHNPNFAISIALVDKGISKLGVVYLPISNDFYWAQEDKKGAFHNENEIHVSSTKDLRETVLACDWSWDLKKRLKVVGWLKNICSEIRQIKCMGSQVADLAKLAQGNIDIYLIVGGKPWDTAASSLIVEKAGGKITTPEGEKWNIFSAGILATNNILHSKIVSLINK